MNILELETPSLILDIGSGIGWLALPWQTVVFCTLAFLVVRFGIAPRLGEGSNEPEPEMLLAAIKMEE